MRILFLGAHFDDIEGGVGGILRKHIIKGDDVYLAVLDSDDDRCDDPKIRLNEQLNSLSLLGLSKDRLLLTKSSDAESVIVGKLDGLNSDTVYTMYGKDSHHAHRRCSDIGRSVARKSSKNLIFYSGGCSYDFIPNVYSNINFNLKLELLLCFASQIHLNSLNIEFIKTRNLYWGKMFFGDGCAEALQISKASYMES